MFQIWQEEMDKGNRALNMRDFVTAEKHFKVALKQAEKFGRNNQNLAQNLESLGKAILGQAPLEDDRLEVCFRCFEDAQSIYEASQGPVSLKVADCLTVMARLIQMFDSSEAEQFARRAVSIYQELDSDKLIEPIEMLALAMHNEGKEKERDELLVDTIDKFESHGESWILAKALILRANFADDKTALVDFQKALSLLKEQQEHTALIVETSVRVGRLLFKEEHFLAAENAFQTAISMGQCAPEVMAVTLEEAMCRMARLKCFYYKEYDEAKSLLDEADAVRQSETDGMIPIGSGVDIELSYLAKASGNIAMQKTLLESQLVESKNVPESMPELESMYAMKTAGIQMSLAEISFLEGDHSKAFELWEAAIENAPYAWMKNNAIAYFAYGYARFGQLQKAKELIDSVIKEVQSNSSPGVLALCIITAHLVGRADMVESLTEVLQEQIEQAKEDPEDEYGIAVDGCLNMAYALICQEKLDEGVRVIKETLASEKKLSLFSAVSFEEWARKFESANAESVSEILRQSAEEIRKHVVEREASQFSTN